LYGRSLNGEIFFYADNGYTRDFLKTTLDSLAIFLLKMESYDGLDDFNPFLDFNL